MLSTLLEKCILVVSRHTHSIGGAHLTVHMVCVLQNDVSICIATHIGSPHSLCHTQTYIRRTNHVLKRDE